LEDAVPYRIEFQKDYRNSKGEPAPWVIVNEDRDEGVGSSATKEAAEASIAPGWRENTAVSPKEGAGDISLS
jgi:hypothetical protein